MPSYVVGLLAALFEPLLHGAANVLDSYFSNRVFERVTSIVFFAQTTNLLFLPIVFLLDPPSLVPLTLIPIVLGIAAIEVLYQYPYFWALRHADTSVVDS